MTIDPAPRLSVVHMVVTDNFAGVERYVCQVANELVVRGHEVTTIGGEPQRMKLELTDAVRNRNASSLPVAAWALARERGADIVHVHMTAAEGAAWLARPAQRAPIVATRHFASERGSTAAARSLARLTSRSIARDIAISQFVADHTVGPTVLIPNGVSAQPQAALEAPMVVMLQRLNTEKAPEVGINAWSISGLGKQGWRLVIAGTGDLQPSLLDLARQLEVSDSITFAGHIAGTDQFLSDASVFLAPAPEEPFGLSVVEAMAHGLPVVAANGGAHAETVADDGILFPPGDTGAAAKALVALSEDVALRRRLGSQLRQRQQHKYSLPLHVDRLEALYREIVAGSGHP